MSGIAIALIVFGLLVAVFRAPLMWAPEKQRGFIVSLFATDGKMRALGLVFALMGAVFAWVGWDVPTTAGAIVKYFGLFIVLISALMVIFTAKARSMAEKVWKSFSVPTLRAIGALSTIFGLLLIFYGLSL